MFALDVIAEQRACERFHERAAEVQRAHFRERQARSEALERLTVDAPPRAAVVVGLVVIQREARFLERLQVAADCPRGDAAETGEIVDGDADGTGPFDLS